MIETDGKSIFMTAGDACYIMRISDGALGHVYFGKRVEPEDDIFSLAGRVTSELGAADIAIERDGKSLALDPVVTGCEVVSRKPRYGDGLDGGKTLVVSLSDYKNSIGIRLLYTPYSQGGFMRRTIIENGGSDAMLRSLSTRIAMPRPLERYDNPPVRGFVAAADGETGEAYGALALFRRDDTAVEKTPFGADLLIRREYNAVIRCGETFTAPETLAVYSDRGVTGMTHIFHDILRERYYVAAERVPAVVFCPPTDGAGAAETVRAAYSLGFDIAVANAGQMSEDALLSFSDECRDRLSMGLRLPVTGITRGSALCFDGLVKRGNALSVDFADGNAVKKYIAYAERIIIDCGAKHVYLDAGALFSEDNADPAIAADIEKTIESDLAEYYRDLQAETGTDESVKLEWDGLNARALDAALVCYPPCMLRSAVTVSPEKTLSRRFDRATFSALGYELDPTALGEIKNTVRAQIISYQDDAPAIMLGDIFEGGGKIKYRAAVAKDKSTAYVLCDVVESCEGARVLLGGLDERNIYHIRELDKTYSGAALVRFGIPLSGKEGDTFVFHLRQVADFE